LLDVQGNRASRFPAGTREITARFQASSNFNQLGTITLRQAAIIDDVWQAVGDNLDQKDFNVRPNSTNSDFSVTLNESGNELRPGRYFVTVDIRDPNSESRSSNPTFFDVL